MRIVIDTNVLVSFLFWEKSPVRASVIQAFRYGEVLRSTESFAELAEVVLREKFDSFLTRAERELFLASFYDHTNYVLVQQRLHACRDPKDNKFLELAVTGQAAFIISGDADLLALDPFEAVRIVSPAVFAASNS